MNIMENILLGKIYRHFKGNLYKPICFARHSETCEEMIVYESLKNSEIWVRPSKMWNEVVDKEGTKRFTLQE